MDSSKDPFSDHSKKMEQSTPVKRPRQKRLQFDIVTMQQQQHPQRVGPGGDANHDLARQMPSHCGGEEVEYQAGDVSRWFNELPQYARRDTPVPEADIEGLVSSEDELWDEIQSLLEVPCPENMNQHQHQHQHQTQHPVQQQHPTGPVENAFASGIHPWNAAAAAAAAAAAHGVALPNANNNNSNNGGVGGTGGGSMGNMNSKRYQRQNHPIPRQERIPVMVGGNCAFLNEHPHHHPPPQYHMHNHHPHHREERQANSPFSVNRSERARFLDYMTPHAPAIFDANPRQSGPYDMLHVDSMRKNPPPSPQRQGRMMTEEDMYSEFPASFTPREWGPNVMMGHTNNGGNVAKIPPPPLTTDHRLRPHLHQHQHQQQQQQQQQQQHNRNRIPGGGMASTAATTATSTTATTATATREPELNNFFTRQNSLFDINYPDASSSERGSGRISVMRERLRRLEHRQSPLEETRDQDSRAPLDRYRARQPIRERRSPCRGSELGAIMSAIGLVHDDDVTGNLREGNSGISLMRDAVFGIVHSRLPPHLLFSERDFDGDDYEFLSRLDDCVESKKGADDKIINKIDLCSFNPHGDTMMKMDDDPRCPICLENFTSGCEIRVMPCHHKYHRCCLDKWLKIKAVCPICNMNIKDKFHGQQQQHH